MLAVRLSASLLLGLVLSLVRAQVDVSESNVIGAVDDMRWIGHESRVVLAKTKLGIVFRSTDGGRSWKRLGPDKENKVVAISTSTSDKNRMILVGEGDDGGTSTQWVSTDGGDKFYKARADVTIREVKFHPNPEVSGWALAFDYKGCQPDEACLGALLLTTNGGGSWREISQNVVFPHYEWAQRLGHGADRSAVIAIQATHNQATESGWNVDRVFVRSNNLFTSSLSQLEKANKFVVVGKFLFVACAESTSDVSLWVSSNQGETFSRIHIVENLKQRGYDLLRGSEFTTLVSIRLGERTVDYGSLYHSDAEGNAWAVSLEHNQHSHLGTAALATVKGVDGVYLANQVINTAQVDSGEATKLRTIISFDDGGKWLPMVPPDTDSAGDHYSCNKEQGGSGCALHLFFRGNSEGYPPVYSNPNAIGLLLATGWVGPFGVSKVPGKSGISTFLSRDAGWTWQEIHKGPHTYDMGDHGAIIVLAKLHEPTQEVLYSWNEGHTWEKVELPKPMTVSNIVTHPNATSQVFVVIAGDEIITIDFSSLHERPCQGADSVEAKDSDYEEWNPRLPMRYFDGAKKNPRSDCLMGQKVVYTRRKRLSQCFNGRLHEKKVVEHTCQCTEADYECDVMYERVMSDTTTIYDPDSMCIWAGEKAVAAGEISEVEDQFGADLANLHNQLLTLDDVCAKYPGHDTLQVASGYRKISGNKCGGGVNLGSQVMHCTAEPTHEISNPDSSYEPSEDEVGEEDEDESTDSVYQDTSDSEKEEYAPELSEDEAEPSEDEAPLRSQDGASPVSFKQEAELFMTRVERQPKQLEHLTPDGATVFLLSQSSGKLYRSFDNGNNWMNSDQWIEGSVFSISVSPSNPDIVYLIGTGQDNWITEDGGQAFENVKTDFTLRSGGVKWHPKKENLAMAYKHPVDCNQDVVRCYGELMLSEDTGRTWRSIAEHVKFPNFEWAINAWPKEHDDAIFTVMHADAEGAKGWDTGLSMYLSEDYFATKKKLSHGNNFVIVGSHIFVAAAASMSEVELWVSNGEKFEKTQIPLSLPQRGYGLLNTLDGSVLLSVRAGDSTVKYGTVLQASEDENQWITTLEHVSHQNGRPTEIAKVHGLDGIYMANVVMNPSSVDMGSDPKVQTKITFDRGAVWHKVTPPSHDHTGKLFECSSMDSCSLNLFFDGNLRGYPSIFSSNNATGLIIANGHVSSSLSEKDVLAEDISTFFSRDGGWSWTHMRKGAHLASFGDHGGLILVAPFQRASSRLFYTYDEGATWGTLHIAESGAEEVIVSDIQQSDPGLGQRFMVLGKLSGSDEGVAITVDFESLHQRPCLGERSPGEDWSDYESWAPKRGCVLGSKTYYARRKARAKCYNGVATERMVERHTCECTDEDFECAAGFSKSKYGDQCELDPDGIELSEKTRDLHAVFRKRQLAHVLCLKYDDSSVHQLVSGWRRIRGDTCIGGQNREDVTIECPESTTLGEDHMLKAVKVAGIHQQGVVTWVTRMEDEMRELIWMVNPAAKGSEALAWGLGAESGLLVRSSNIGQSWSHESVKLSGAQIISMDSDAPSGVAKVSVAPLDTSSAFLVGYGTSHWLTSDSGKTYLVSKLTEHIESRIVWHPTHPKMALAYQRNQHCQHHSAVCFGSLLLTVDAGMQWKPVFERVKFPNFGWDTSSHHHIMAIQHSEHSELPKSSSGMWDPEFRLVRQKVDEHGTRGSTENILDGGNNFAVLGAYCFVARAESATRVSLWVNQASRALKKAEFPAELAQRSYAVLDTAESGAIFLSVRDGDADVKYSSLYLSDHNGHSWSVSMRHTHHEPGYGVDLAKIHSFEGIYLANQVLNPEATRQGEPTQLQTVITFDQGGEWFAIMPPKVDVDGKPFKCVSVHSSTKCRLHLLFPQNKQGLYGVYSPERSNGLVLATGFVGPTDAPNDIVPAEVSLFMSRDAGHSWTEIRKGPHAYEIADHGALIAASKFGSITNQIVFSWDQGLTWKEITIPPAEVTNIVTQPNSISQQFVVLCRKLTHTSGENSHAQSATIALDLSGLHQRQCAGVDVPDSPQSDFELWTPHQGDQKCIQGQLVQYVRRKRQSKCYYGVGDALAGKGATKGKSSTCECTLEDFVCEYGFERKGERCVWTGTVEESAGHSAYKKVVADLYWDDSLLDEACRLSNGTEIIIVESGFKLVSGTKCEGGKEYPSKKMACEANMNVAEEVSFELWSHWGIVAGVVGVALTAGGLYYLWMYFSGGAAKYAPVSTSMESVGDGVDGDQIEQHFGFDDFEDDLISKHKSNPFD